MGSVYSGAVRGLARAVTVVLSQHCCSSGQALCYNDAVTKLVCSVTALLLLGIFRNKGAGEFSRCSLGAKTH